MFISIYKKAFIAGNYTLYTTRIRCATLRPLQKRGETGLHNIFKMNNKRCYVDQRINGQRTMELVPSSGIFNYFVIIVSTKRQEGRSKC